MRFKVTGIRAIECIMLANEITDVPAKVILALHNECISRYDKNVIEFTKLTKQRLCETLNIHMDMLNKRIKQLVDYKVLEPMPGVRGAYNVAGWVLELNFSMALFLSTDAELAAEFARPEKPAIEKKSYKVGELMYDKGSDRYIIINKDDNTIINDGLHCGDNLDIFYKDAWVSTTIEMTYSSKGKSRWYLVGVDKRKRLDGMHVRLS